MMKHEDMVSVLSKSEQLQRLDFEKFMCHRKNEKDPVSLTGAFCNRTWDDVVCWPDTPAGQVASQPCPTYINFFDQAENVTRYCTDEGTWWVNPDTNKSWSNYSLCIKVLEREDQVHSLISEHMPGIKLMYTIGYSLSLATLILALTIMIYFKRLHCPRNLIHMNMFLAFGIRSAFSLMRNVLLVNDLGFANDVNNTGEDIKFVDEGTHWECKLFFTLFYYVIFASVMWLFNEGLYLQLILSVAVFADKTKIRYFVLLGWGTPLIFVLPWVVCRIKLDDMLCWNVHQYRALYWILHAPMVMSVGLNFIIFINIIRLLFTKLRAVNCPDSKMHRYRKLAKSTLILIPLFAVYYMIFIWLPDDFSPLTEVMRIYVEMLFNSFQGFLVALLFCFLNHEVQYEIRKKWQRRALRSQGGGSRRTSFYSFFRSRDQRDYCSREHSKALRSADGTKRRFGALSSFSEDNSVSHPTSHPTSHKPNGSTQAHPSNSHSDDPTQPLVPHNTTPGAVVLRSKADVNSPGPESETLVICNENYKGHPEPRSERKEVNSNLIQRICPDDLDSCPKQYKHDAATILQPNEHKVVKPNGLVARSEEIDLKDLESKCSKDHPTDYTTVAITCSTHSPHKYIVGFDCNKGVSL